MVNFKNLTVKSLVINIVRRILSTVAILLLIISITSPFCSAGSDIFDMGIGGLFWSYRSDFYHYWGPVELPGPRPKQYWFFDYWFSFLDQNFPELIWMTMPMFILQALTLTFGIISTIFNRKILLLAPFYLSITVLGLMIYTANTLFGKFMIGNFEQGYYFMYYPVGLFLFASALNNVPARATST